MHMTAAIWGLAAATFLASAVEFVEAFTIVLAMGLSRSWRAALMGTVAALLALTVVTAVAGVALIHWVSESVLQLVIGTLLLLFGLQWLRKAILRASGYKPLHDEAAAFERERAEAVQAGRGERSEIDWYSFTVSFKGVFLEGVEVAFIVITFGAAQHNGVATAAAAAGAALVIVLGAGVLVRAPLSRVPENTLKFVVGLLLSTFGTFWAAEGAGVSWPGEDGALLGILGVLLLVSLGAVRMLRHERGLGALSPARRGGAA